MVEEVSALVAAVAVVDSEEEVEEAVAEVEEADSERLTQATVSVTILVLETKDNRM